MVKNHLDSEETFWMLDPADVSTWKDKQEDQGR